MNKIVSLDTDASALDELEASATLTTLTRFVRLDACTDDLIVENGRARFVLERDGTIRLEGTRIVGVAGETIALHAGVIEFN